MLSALDNQKLGIQVQVAYVFIVLVWWLLFPYNFEWNSSLLALLRTLTMQCAHNIAIFHTMQQQSSRIRNNEPTMRNRPKRGLTGESVILGGI